MVRLSLLLLLGGCLIDKAAYEDALSALTDADGDGVPPAGGDCDDADPSRYPGAEEVYYDGIDADCAGDDDDDADGDGDPSADHGGADCDDEDPAISSLTEEGWSDLGTDNDCDGTLDEPVSLTLGDQGVSVEGPKEDVGLGLALLALDDVEGEPLVLAGGPFYEDDHGLAVAWPARDLFGGAGLDGATWTVTGDDALSVLGIAFGWAGDPAEPQVWVSASGALDGGGEVTGFAATDLLIDQTSPSWRVEGTSPGDYFGYEILRGYDHDGDGVADLVVGSALDSREAELGGVTRVFLGPGAGADVMVDEDADWTVVTDQVGGFMRVNAPGDIDGDGLDDLAFTREVESSEDGAGLIVTTHDSRGTIDVEDAASATLFGQIWGVEDVDSDGYGELFATAGALSRYELPLVGTEVTPWDQATTTWSFSADADFAHWADRRSVETPAGVRYATSSTTWPAGAGDGAVFFASARDEGEATLDDVGLVLVGEAAGDAAGTAVERVPDVTGDTWPDWIVGAPGADAPGDASGRIYAVPGPS